MKRLDKRIIDIFSKYAYKLSYDVKDNIIFLSGRVHSYEEKYMIGEGVASLKAFEHVVNNIEVDNLIIPETRYNHEINTNEFNNQECDVLVIGGGIIGCAILRELTKYKLNCILVEKEEDVALHASSRNDGNIHPGVDLHPGTLKQKYLIRSHELWPDLAKELNIRYIKTGQILAYRGSKIIFNAFARYKSKENEIKNVSYYGKSGLKEIEPNINGKASGGILFGDAAQISPYEATIAFAENAINNGAKIYLNTFVKGMIVLNHDIKEVITNRGALRPKVVINAAGVFSEDIAKMADDHFFSIHPRKGTDIILDKKTFGKYAKHTIGLKSLADAHSKTKGGGLVVTVEDNYLVGPDANEVPYKEDFSTSKDSIINILNKQKGLFRNISTRDVITYFSGIRACTYEEDFIVQKGKWTRNIIHAAGIQSPGLSSAPAIAEEVAKLAARSIDGTKINKEFNPHLEKIKRMNEVTLEEKEALIRENPNYGVIVCRCEKISKQEIINALHRPLPCNTIDGIKRRVRAGMGRCQGGFCEPVVLSIMAEELKKDYLDIKKKGNASVLYRKSKE